MGKPLTDPRLIPSLINEKGEFKSSKEYRSAESEFVVLEEVVLEIEAQYQRFKEIVLNEPSYIDGHAVASENFFKGIEIVASNHNLKQIPFSKSFEPVTVGKTKMYMYMESMRPDYDPMKVVREIIDNSHEDGCDVMVCHPGYLDAYIIKNSSMLWARSMEVDMLCSDSIKSYIEESGIMLATYDDM